MSNQELAPQFYTEFRELLIRCFDESELKRLCVDLGVDYDGLAGLGKNAKALELVHYLQRRKTPDGILKALELTEKKRHDRQREFEYLKLYVTLYVESPSGILSSTKKQERKNGLVRQGRRRASNSKTK
jgi:hypothetical protein